VRMPLTFDNYLDEPATALRVMLIEPAAISDAEPLAALRQERTPADAVLMIGPEGGWEEREWSSARDRGIRLMSLGPRTLRADAVPVAAISVLEFLWDLAG
jgi:16S rRNA (uracil1498-N3)-methyltransferase